MTQFLDEMEECVPALRRYARALTGNADQADDLVQDCLERALQKRRLWRPTGPLRAWLFKMLINIYRNDLRRNRRRPQTVPYDPYENGGFEPATPARQIHALALSDTVRALDRLPDEQREALVLVALDGTSYADAADILGVPQGTLMSRLGRARAALRELTGAEQPPRLRTVK
jgi:RNA polymerase sigma-70 factor (ECF subfamily)